LFITDFMPRNHPADLVLPIGPSGKYLANATVRANVESGLDLGCGCGIQALLMAKHARHVTATDINPRAVALTHANAILNGFNNIEILEGSYFEPVHGRTFDLIAINLPYVLSPTNEYAYRDLGSEGENRIRQTVEETTRHLNEGGYAHLMLNWTHRADQNWWQPIEEWTRSRQVDAWTVHSKSESPTEYVKPWILVNEDESPHEYQRIKEQWQDWFKSQKIERIASGLMTLRRRTGKSNWHCSVHAHQIADEPLGRYIQHLFQNQDFLAHVSHSGDLLNMKLRPWNMKVVKTSSAGFIARTMRGFLVRMRILTATAAVIGQLNDSGNLGEAVQNVIEKSGESASDKEMIAKDIYQLINLGMIEIVE
jgi:methylase of polypeptide subunit release factors